MSHRDTSFFRPIEGESTKAVELVMPAAGIRKVTAHEAACLVDLDRLVAEHQGKQFHYRGGRIDEKVRGVIEHYHDVATNSLRRVKEFRDDLMVHLRAISLVIEMAGNAATHSEKNARLRGTLELIEGAISKLRREQFAMTFSSGPAFDDVFRSDYPTRDLLNRIRELEAEVKRLSRPPAEGESADDGEVSF